MSSQAPGAAGDRDGLQPPLRFTRDGRSLSNTSSKSPLGSFMTGVNQPGSFSTDLKSTATPRNEYIRPEFGSFATIRPLRSNDDKDGRDISEQRVAEYREQIDKETKIKMGSENLLEALNAKNAKQTREQRLRVESELNTSSRKIARLKSELEAEMQRSKREKSASPQGRLSQLFRNSPIRSPSRLDADEEGEEDTELAADTESPTFVLAEILQSLEIDSMPSEYYVERANNLVDLFKRNPTLKYDLVWSIFGLRMQVLLLSESREVVAAGFRLMRHAITDQRSLQIMRSLHTDYLVCVSLVKESKASVEREQALKFVRAFLDVKNGVEEIARMVVRVIVAIADHHDDRMRNISILTLSEILVRKPSLVVSAGGLGVLSDALADGNYHPAESLTCAFLYLQDTPSRRCYLKSGHELTGPFAMFTDVVVSVNEEKLKSSARVISALLKSWTGLMSLAINGLSAFQSIFASLSTPSVHTRDIILDLLLDVLRVKPPTWSSSFLAGRRLTSYGRVTHFKVDPVSDSAATPNTETGAREALVEQFTAVMLALFFRAGLIESLVIVVQDEFNVSVKRKATLLLGEILNKASEILPGNWIGDLQVLPQLFARAATVLDSEERHLGSSAIYQIDSVNRILYRTGHAAFTDSAVTGLTSSLRRPSDLSKDNLTPQIEEGHFRAVMMETQVLSTVNYTKWRWDLIPKIIEGPLLNPKRLEEATKATKFVKRLLGFYRPFKFRFCDVRNTKPNQRYVRVGCMLIRTLLQTPEGVRYLAEDKLLRQVAECLAQLDRMSGLTSLTPMFSADRISETLTGGYFAMLGVVSGSPKGLLMMERWKMANMFHHIVELPDRDDLIKLLINNMDYTLDSHLRVVLSKALTSCSSDVRIFATRVLRQHSLRGTLGHGTSPVDSECVEWALQLLTTQLYDPEVGVCEAAVHILEEACNDTRSLEYVVRCRPALDHLGEIGAPLLLRFLSTSVGYHYLDDLDYISQEMDGWFLGRNDSYVTLAEASLTRALTMPPGQGRDQPDEGQGLPALGVAPPHFYRELTRTAEGCKLLEQKGHFEEFVSIIRNSGFEDNDQEMMLKVKGCMWAVGNIGSMELGAPFLESTDVVELIIGVAENSGAMSMRGTAFFVLGLISRSIHGQEILAQHGWEVAVDKLGESLGICLPADLKKLFSMKPTKPLEDATEFTAEAKASFTDEDPTNARILTLVTDLCNTVLSKSRASELNSIKTKKAPGFRHPSLFHKVMQVLEQHRFRLPVLRFVIDLFDKRVMRQIVLEEESDESEDDNTSDLSGDRGGGAIDASDALDTSDVDTTLTAVTAGADLRRTPG